jgi:hypothetical protein
MRQGRLEIPPRFLKSCSSKGAPACQRQPTNQFLAVNERSGLEEMLSYLAGALVSGIRIEPFDRFGDARVQALSAERRDASKQCLPDKFMSESRMVSLGLRGLGRLSPSAVLFR